METYYKVLVDGKSCHGGTLEWDLPKKNGEKWIPGKWMEVNGNLAMCEHGLHVTTAPYNWYTWGCECYVAEIDGAIDNRGDKILCRKARLLRIKPHPQWWLDSIAFVESIKDVPFFKPDGKPLKKWKLFYGESWAAARAAARAAVRDAAWDAARDASRVAAWTAARAAAGVAAGVAARDAAWAAAGDAARDAVRDAAGAAVVYTTVVNICSGLELEKKHRKHAIDRWRVWQKGYGLLCDVNGVLYVYAKTDEL